MIKLRHANRKDCRLLWQWANDPQVQAVSFVPEPILYEDHVKWLEERLTDPDCQMYMAEDIANDRRPESVGQVRFERKGQAAVISVSLGRQFRARGLGACIIELASRTYLAATDAKVINAYIKADNAASLAAFKRAGYSSGKSTSVANQPAHHLFFESEEEDETLFRDKQPSNWTRSPLLCGRRNVGQPQPELR